MQRLTSLPYSIQTLWRLPFALFSVKERSAKERRHKLCIEYGLKPFFIGTLLFLGRQTTCQYSPFYLLSEIKRIYKM